MLTLLLAFLRPDGLPSYYGSNLAAARYDVFIVAVTIVAAMIGVAWLAVIPTGKTWRSTLFINFAFILSIFVITAILIGQYSMSWRTDEITTITQYTSFNNQHIRCRIGLHIGLRGFNVTLVGIPEYQQGQRLNYNEFFSWEWEQGRTGTNAGRIMKDVEKAHINGLPYPILWIAEYFTLDGEWIRWGRYYREAGYYGHIALWTALPVWFFTLIVFPMALTTGIIMMMITGFLFILSSILYGSISSTVKTALSIPFRGGTLAPTYGWTFYFVLFTGIILFCIGLLLLILVRCCHVHYRWSSERTYVKSASDEDQIHEHDIPLNALGTSVPPTPMSLSRSTMSHQHHPIRRSSLQPPASQSPSHSQRYLTTPRRQSVPMIRSPPQHPSLPPRTFTFAGSHSAPSSPKHASPSISSQHASIQPPSMNLNHSNNQMNNSYNNNMSNNNNINNSNTPSISSTMPIAQFRPSTPAPALPPRRYSNPNNAATMPLQPLSQSRSSSPATYVRTLQSSSGSTPPTLPSGSGSTPPTYTTTLASSVPIYTPQQRSQLISQQPPSYSPPSAPQPPPSQPPHYATMPPSVSSSHTQPSYAPAQYSDEIGY